MSYIVELLESFLGHNRGHNSTTGQMQFDCPACSEYKGMIDGDGKGNLEVNYNKGYFHCWVCGEENRMKGKLPTLIKRYGNDKILKDFYLVKSEFKTIVTGESSHIKLPDSFHLFTKTNENYNMYGEAMHYLRKRGITDDIIEEKRLGFCDYGKYKGRIIIPSYDSFGDLNYFVGRSFKKWVKPKILNENVEKSSIIFNEWLINWDSTIYLVEGPFDHLITPNSIPLLGKYVSDYLYEMLQMKARSNVVILLDGDAWADIKKLYIRLNIGNLKDRVKVIQLNPKYDPSKIYEKFGRRTYLKLLSNTKKIPESLL